MLILCLVKNTNEKTNKKQCYLIQRKKRDTITMQSPEGLESSGCGGWRGPV